MTTPTLSPVRSVAFLGLGAMGAPMCRRLLPFHDVTVFDVAADRVVELREAGAAVGASPADAAKGADAVVLAVRDAAQLQASLFGPDGVAPVLSPGAVVILTSTVGPAVVRDTASRLAALDVAVLDAPVSGGPVRAGKGDLVVMVGAETAVLDRCRPVLDRLASSVAHVGPRPGDGQAMKVVNQLLCGVHIAAAAEALTLAKALGVDPQAALDVLGKGAAASFMLADRGPRMLADEPPVRSRLDIFVKDMGIVTDVAREAGVATPVAGAAEQLYLLGKRAGHGSRDDSRVIDVLDPRA
ncbi:NAD(P)-dependent oxidoreductase [Saccharothrix sp.]|uniref:NAD(P)-dependent oxidoreductase n=1 Tax=Saccharothrix sp. TaxID=1873460 RepID=UPI002811C3B5|nr:NAD(P)-dependent oxidoreductase [Saccharothrix sp.]